MKKRKEKKGALFYKRWIEFTLIELLITICIIAVLAAILLPALNKAKSVARQSACSAKIRQIGLATHNYLSDNGDTYYSALLGPYLSGDTTTDLWTSNPTLWAEYLLIYTGIAVHPEQREHKLRNTVESRDRAEVYRRDLFPENKQRNKFAGMIR